MFLVFDWGTDPETHSGMELYCPVPVQHESGCFGVLRRWRSTYKTVNHQSHLVRHYLPTAAQLWFKIYTRLTNSSTATPGSCTTKVSIMPGLLLFFFFFPWFWWPNFHFYLRFPRLLLFPNKSCVVAITDLTMLDWRSFGRQRGNWEIKLMSIINFTHPVFTCLHKYCYTDISLQLIHHFLF